MAIFGDLERLLAALYPYRVPATVVALVVLVVGGALLVRRGAHRPPFRFVRAHLAASAVATLVLLAVLVPVGNYLLSPLWTRSGLAEASPIEVARATAATTAVPGASPAASTATLPRVLVRGAFAGADDFHFGRGNALLIEVSPGRHTLRFEDFSVRNGPTLFVYLSDDAKGYGGTVLKLGPLRATDGSFNYEVPAGTDIARFRSAIVWCEQFSVLFATAPLS